MRKPFYVLLAGMALMAACSKRTAVSKTESKPKPTAMQMLAQSAGYNPASFATEYVVVSTRFGDMTLGLYNATPQHRDNFLKLAREGYYNGTLFHRVIANFMIQGGDPDSRGAAPGKMLGNGGPAYTIPSEFVDSLFHRKGALAAARDNNPAKASSGSQFYIVEGRKWSLNDLQAQGGRAGRQLTDAQKQVYSTIGGTPHLDGNYTVFGQLLSGFNVLDSIAAQPGDANNRPKQDVQMTVKVVK